VKIYSLDQLPGLWHRGRQEPTMFLRRYTRTQHGKKHHYYALVESVRTEAGQTSRVSRL
jgi:hypothetical protein